MTLPITGAMRYAFFRVHFLDSMKAYETDISQYNKSMDSRLQSIRIVRSQAPKRDYGILDEMIRDATVFKSRITRLQSRMQSLQLEVDATEKADVDVMESILDEKSEKFAALRDSWKRFRDDLLTAFSRWKEHEKAMLARWQE